jgi:hypothetical protein
MIGFERGSGLLPTVFGLALLLAMLGLACNVALGLWSRTTTESIAYEAARSVATAEPGADQEAVRDHALERACELLGNNCADVDLHFEPTTADQPMVSLRVSSPGVGVLPRFIADGGPVVGALDRTIRIRREGL